MQVELWDALIDFRDDPDTWVAILTGAGDAAFCAGADLKWGTEHPGEPVPWKRNYRSNPRGWAPRAIGPATILIELS